MSKIFLGIWRFMKFTVKSLGVALQLVMAAVFFLGAAAEITSLMLSHGSIIMENIRNLAAIVAHSDIPQKSEEIPKPAAPRACLRYEKRLTDLRCEEKTNPADKLLCKITVPPTELVCVEYQPQS